MTTKKKARAIRMDRVLVLGTSHQYGPFVPGYSEIERRAIASGMQVLADSDEDPVAVNLDAYADLLTALRACRSTFLACFPAIEDERARGESNMTSEYGGGAIDAYRETCSVLDRIETTEQEA
jgi:hypothetical protein